MGFWTDWYDFPQDGELNKLADLIKRDAVTESRRPTATDLSLMISKLEDVYSPKTSNIIGDILIELGNAAKMNITYNKALFDTRVFANYCALFMVVHQKNVSKLKSLDDLCKTFSPDFKFADVISAYVGIFAKREFDMMRAAAGLKVARDGNY